jgi:Outer membrane efflux protein
MIARATAIAAAGLLVTLPNFVQAAGSPSKPTPDEAAQVAALQKERSELLETLVKILVDQYSVGTVDFDKLSSAEHKLCEARLEAAEGDSKKTIAILTEQLKFAEDIVAVVKARFKAGTVTEADVIEAQAQCLGVKVKLLRARGQSQPSKPAPGGKQP